ncbi:MAG TPA: leucine--tRNA ligase, partial [archaeon]|nr:leucine--tRNA ligase [archaeon]
MDFRPLDKKWQKKWATAKLFEANPSAKKKFFSSIVIPYVNGDAHIGHSYTFTRTDAYARFKRMQGFNVLLAQGFHATGEPILGAVERLRANDPGQIETYRLFGATAKDIEAFKKKGPKYVAEFWSEKIANSFDAIGFGIDKRRVFTLSLDPRFSRFIEWQYNTLRKKGYVVQGTHPVVWCPKDLSPTGDHDRLKGEGESPADYVLVRFSYNGYVLPAATLRPETVYGVTNMWLNPDADYVEANVEGEKWIVSKRAADKLKDQMKVEVVGKFDVNELIGKMCGNPADGREIPILPSGFVDPDNATGVVMSVPAHAPYDWIALKEAGSEIKPIGIINTPGFGELPAVELCEKMKITSLNQVQELDEATAILYKKEFHTGILTKCGPYTGMKVSESKDKLTLEFIDKDIADVMWEVAGVVCRCGTPCHVKILENQWFLKYSDEQWKKEARKCLGRMKVYPDEARNNFENTIDWLKDKACARKSGLGTPVPWDKEWIIETLSDSTIYMAYYTIAKTINKNKIPAEKLTSEVFDYVFLGKGDPKTIAKKTRLGINFIKEMKKEFEYFYPFDARVSGKDLVQNHLTFFIFQHTALFPENKWPKAIAVNGFVSVEGEKMSKSKGNIIPLINIVKQHGADMVRINIAGSSQSIDDADWREDGIKSYKARYEMLIDVIKGLKKMKRTTAENIDVYLQSRLQRHIEAATTAYEKTMFRDAVQTALFEATNDLKWYLRRTDANRKIVKNYVETIVKMVTPLTPHVCEEMWKLLGNRGFVSAAEWPQTDVTKVSIEAELSEEMLRKTLADIEEVRKITNMTPKRARLFVAENWKFRVHNTVMKSKDKNVNDITKEIMSTGGYGKATVAFIQSLYKKINELQPVVPRMMQFAILEEAASFMEKEAGCKIVIEDAEKSENPKAKSSTPNKFGIFLE